MDPPVTRIRISSSQITKRDFFFSSFGFLKVTFKTCGKPVAGVGVLLVVGAKITLVRRINTVPAHRFADYYIARRRPRPLEGRECLGNTGCSRGAGPGVSLKLPFAVVVMKAKRSDGTTGLSESRGQEVKGT